MSLVTNVGTLNVQVLKGVQAWSGQSVKWEEVEVRMYLCEAVSERPSDRRLGDRTDPRDDSCEQGWLLLDVSCQPESMCYLSGSRDGVTFSL